MEQQYQVRTKLTEDRCVLPCDVIPQHYDIELDVDLDTSIFSGLVVAKIHFVYTTDKIVLNARDLNICSTSSFLAIGLEKYHFRGTVYDDKKEQISFNFSENFQCGTNGSLWIFFNGKISDKLTGFYKSTYKTRDNVTRQIALTKFEPTHARKAFPCWDEPDKKATFTISLKVRQHLTALSNMNENVHHPSGVDVGRNHHLFLTPEEGWKIVNFAPSLKMSTYLVAFVIGELEWIEAFTKPHGGRKIPVRIYAPMGFIHQGHFALDVGVRTLDHFADYFGIPYPLPKMDMVAIPDFASGAMENWGLVTYRMTLLLFDDTASTLKTKQQVAYVVGHELAHQWFGNLVTMEWWSDLWLNEGFATWAGWLAADHLFPEWEIWTEFVVDDLQSGLALDALRTSHPIEVPVRDPSDISQIFDSISYSKGASVIRMLEAYLGSATFQKGLCDYLQKHLYANARTDDLWAALDAASGKSVSQMMTRWTRTMGYPVVSLSISEVVGAQGGGSLVVEQHRFLSSGDVQAIDDEAIWHVPLNILHGPLKAGRSDGATTSLSMEPIMLTKRRDQFAIPMLHVTEDFVKLNGEQTGFYRVAYPKAMLDRLGAAVTAGLLGPSDRLGILNDVFSLAFALQTPTIDALNLLGTYRDAMEQDLIIWMEISGQLGKLKSMLFEHAPPTREALSRLMLELFSPIVDRLGWEFSATDPDKVMLLRALAISVCGSNGHQGVLAEARRRFELFTAEQQQGGDVSALHPNIRGPVFSMLVKHGDVAEYEKTYQIYVKSINVADAKVIALSALSSTRQPELIERTLEMALDRTRVKSQDVIYIFRNMAANEAARRATWSFVKEHWGQLYGEFYRGSLSLLSSVVGASTGMLTTIEDAIEVKKFFDHQKEDISAIARVVEQSIEKIKNTAQWIEKESASVEKWLQATPNDQLVG